MKIFDSHMHNITIWEAKQLSTKVRDTIYIHLAHQLYIANEIVGAFLGIVMATFKEIQLYI